MPSLAEIAGIGGGRTQLQPTMQRAGTVIQSPQGPMVVLPDGRIVPFTGGGVPGVNGAMRPGSGWQMPSPIIGGRG